MKYTKRAGSLILSALLCLSLAACGTTDDTSAPEGDTGEAAPTSASVETKEFTSPSGSFTVKIPEVEGGWTETNGSNEEHLVLDNADQSLSILVQGLPKADAASQYPDLDSLVEYYQANVTASYGEPTEETVTVPDALNVKAESYTATQGGTTAKALVAYIEMEEGYYIYTITGLEEVYDANIEAQQAAISQFTVS